MKVGRVFRRLWPNWVGLWNGREDATALALCRISLALTLFYDFWEVRSLGLIEALWSIAPDGYANPYPQGWGAWLFDRGPESAHLMWWLVVLSLFAMCIGFCTRLACVLVIVLASQIAYLAPEGDRGIDMMMRIFIGIVACSRSNARLSVDAWLWRLFKRPLDPVVPSWPRLLLMVQLIWIYFSGGINKSGAEWGPHGGFLALANTLADPHFARFDPGWVETLLPLTRVATAVTIVFEITAPIYLLFYYYARTPDRGGRIRRVLAKYRIRWQWIVIGGSFHIGIAMFMRLGIFPFGMLAVYPALLLPEELWRMRSWVRRRMGKVDEPMPVARVTAVATAPAADPPAADPPAEDAAPDPALPSA